MAPIQRYGQGDPATPPLRTLPLLNTQILLCYCAVEGLGFGSRLSAFGFRLSTFGFRVMGAGFRISGFGLGV
jgi:hypothetical protein